MNTLKDLGHDKVLHSVFQILDLLLGGVSLSVEVQMKMKINTKSTIAVYPATNFSIEPRFDNFNFLAATGRWETTSLAPVWLLLVVTISAQEASG